MKKPIKISFYIAFCMAHLQNACSLLDKVSLKYGEQINLGNDKYSFWAGGN